MTCKACGYVHSEDFSCCPSCGAPAPESIVPENAPTQPDNTAAEAILQALKDPLFLVLCILMSVSCVLHLIASGPDVLAILFTIFFWLTYAQSRKGIADPSHLRCVSGTVYAHYVIVNVGGILLIVIGLLTALAFGSLSSDTALVNEFLSAIDITAADSAFVLEALSAVSGIVIFISFALVGGLMLLINIFSIRRIHRFAKSVYQSILSGNLALECGCAAHNWLIAFGIISGLGILDSLSSGDAVSILSSGVSCALPIIAAILMKKHLLSDTPVN